MKAISKVDEPTYGATKNSFMKKREEDFQIF